MPDNENYSNNLQENSADHSGIVLQFRHKLALVFAILLCAVALTYWLLFQSVLQRSTLEHHDILGRSLAEQTAASVRELVLVNDRLGLNVELAQLVRNESILSVSIHDVDDNILASAGPADNPSNGTNLYSAPIMVQEAMAGSVNLHINPDLTRPLQARLRNLFLTVLVLSLVLVIALAYLLASKITRPLKSLTAIINEQTDEDPEDHPRGIDETDDLESAVGRLLIQFREMESRLLETGVWESDNRMEPSRIAASILVIKVVNVHTAIELLHPGTLADLLQEYKFYLKQAVRLYGGVLQRDSGESIMVSFDAGTCGGKHSIHALQCAGLFQSIMDKVNKRHRKNGEQLLEFRMAIHSGDVFLAPDIQGKEERDGLRTMGKTVDITYFLSKQSAPHELVISESAYSSARQFESFETARQNQVSMPADNVSFMAYILNSGFAESIPLIIRQRDHVLDNDHCVDD